MSRLFGIDISEVRLSPAEQEARLVLTERPLRRILAVAGRTIDEVVNCPLAKNQVLGYYKLRNQVIRQSEISELERWWKLV